MDFSKTFLPGMLWFAGRNYRVVNLSFTKPANCEERNLSQLHLIEAMRVNGPNPYSNVSGRGQARRRKPGTDFSADGPAESTHTSASATVATLQGVDGLLALQEVGDAGEGRKKAVQHGHDILDELDAVHLDLLAGNVSQTRLDRLVRLLAARKPSGDSNIESIIAEIEVRAHVELAKRNRFPV